MLKYVRSEYADSIYYSDLFRIDEKIWLILGFGKSEAARIASGKERNNDLSRDCTAIKAEADNLFGRYDPGAIAPKNNTKSDLHKFHRIDFIAYCLSPEQTDEVFSSRPREIIFCSAELMSVLAVVYPYPAYCAPYAFSPEEYANLADTQRRSNKFLEKIKQSGFKNLFLVPYMIELESKARLYNTFVPENAGYL